MFDFLCDHASTIFCVRFCVRPGFDHTSYSTLKCVDHDFSYVSKLCFQVKTIENRLNLVLWRSLVKCGQAQLGVFDLKFRVNNICIFDRIWLKHAYVWNQNWVIFTTVSNHKNQFLLQILASITILECFNYFLIIIPCFHVKSLYEVTYTKNLF